jgi:hypothetical protein
MMHCFSTFKILPRNGKLLETFGHALFSRSPAESPSTRYTSHFAGSCSEQSESPAIHRHPLRFIGPFHALFSGVLALQELL